MVGDNWLQYTLTNPNINHPMGPAMISGLRENLGEYSPEFFETKSSPLVYRPSAKNTKLDPDNNGSSFGYFFAHLLAMVEQEQLPQHVLKNIAVIDLTVHNPFFADKPEIPKHLVDTVWGQHQYFVTHDGAEMLNIYKITQGYKIPAIAMNTSIGGFGVIQDQR